MATKQNSSSTTRRQVLACGVACAALAAIPSAVKADGISPEIARLAAAFWRALGEHHAMLSSPDHTDADADRTGDASGDAYCALLEVPAVTLADLGEKARVIWAEGLGTDPKHPQLIYEDFTLLMLFRDIERVTGCERMTAEYDSASGWVRQQPLTFEAAGAHIGWRDSWGVS